MSDQRQQKMMNTITEEDSATAEAAIEWALAHGVAFRTSPSTSRHTPFALTPTPIQRERFQSLKSKAGLLGKLVHAASEDDGFLKEAMGPMIAVAGEGEGSLSTNTSSDPFFQHLWQMHEQLLPHISNDNNSATGGGRRRVPMLIMRSDFMDDAEIGPKLIEFNGIAAGMGPFGQRIHELHSYLQTQHPQTYTKWCSSHNNRAGEHQQLTDGKLVENKGMERLADGIAKASRQIKQEFQDDGPPRFLMVVQDKEDNVYDQHLLEYALQARGIQTVRRTFKQLHSSLKTGSGHRLLLDTIGPIDTVYLRAGYLHSDYYDKELDGDDGEPCGISGSCRPSSTSSTCCQSLMKTRVYMERHRVAMNATVNQQLASSKRVQTLLSAMTTEELHDKFGLSVEEAESVKDLLGENWPVTADLIQWMRNEHQDPQQWVLKNQGEGGGHAVMGDDILPKLQQLTPNEYPAWSIMRRLRPAPRLNSTVLVRDGQPKECTDLISEIGIFTIHINGLPAVGGGDDSSAGTTSEEEEEGYAGYLIRSKPAQASEGGVHSGLGVLDSLVYH